MDKIINILKTNTDYVSGEYIGTELNITRSAVWKNIRKLKENGYDIISVTNKGYKLDLENSFNKDMILENLPTKIMGKNTVFFNETDSTNTQLKLIATKDGINVKEGTLVIANTMTMGRGRLGRTWTANKCEGIWLSLLLKPNIPPENASVITLLAGIAVAQGIENSTGIHTNIKWPNDVLVRGKKICGILTEMDCEMERVNFIILGIGINVKTTEFDNELEKIATSIALEKGATTNRTKILHSILLEFERLYRIFIEKNNGFLPFVSQYEKLCVNIGNKINVLGNETFEAVGLGITPDGGLIVKRSDNQQEQIIVSGEVSIRSIS